MRALVRTDVPLVVAKSLTCAAQAAQRAILAELPRVFEGGASRYTLNSTRLEPATVGNLVARVAVKDRSTNAGNLPENYLFPQVFGGPRKEKRFERNLRFAGVLQPGARAVIGKDAPAGVLDAQGNLRRSEVQKILQAARSGDTSRYYTGQLGKTAGVFRRKGKGKKAELQPLLIFVNRQPRYAPRLDFEGIARATAQREFPPIFRRLLAKAKG